MVRFCLNQHVAKKKSDKMGSGSVYLSVSFMESGNAGGAGSACTVPVLFRTFDICNSIIIYYIILSKC